MWHFQFLLDWSSHYERYILLKTPLESDKWFQSYSNWKIIKTVETKEIISFLWLYLKINAPDVPLILLDRNTHIMSQGFFGK